MKAVETSERSGHYIAAAASIKKVKRRLNSILPDVKPTKSSLAFFMQLLLRKRNNRVRTGKRRTRAMHVSEWKQIS